VILIFLRLIIFLLLTLALLPFQFIIVFFIKNYTYIIPYFYHKICLRIFGIKIKTFGKVSINSPILLISNHASYLDIIILGSLFKTSFIAKKEISKWPLLGILAKLQNTIFIDRRVSSLKNQENQIIKHLNEKKNLVIFPEGTSSDGNRVLPFKSSLFNIFEKNLNSKILVQTITIVYKKINGIPMNRIERKNITWHSNMDLIPNIFNVLKKLSIEVEVIFNDEFLPSKEYDRKKLALHCWEKINYNLINSLYRK
jgi:1-acyl-sn-glycerol-3-phosphate acyltransferase